MMKVCKKVIFKVVCFEVFKSFIFNDFDHVSLNFTV